MRKRVAILQSNYIPWKGYFDLINSVDEFVLYDTAQFTKNDWRNRKRSRRRVAWHGLQFRSATISGNWSTNTLVANQRRAQNH